MNEIDLLKSNLETFPNIKSLISEKDIEKWVQKLSGYSDPIADYVEKSKYNILTTLISAKHYDSSDKLLRFLEDSLMIFPNLKDSDTFKRNIKSLEDYAFFSFLSELSLSRYLKGLGFSLNFNKVYKRVKKDKCVERDVDIEASLKDNQKIYFEIYTPNAETDINGFFDLSSLGDKFEQKVKNKEFDKFDNIVSGQLNGQIVLAINYTYDDNSNIYLTTSNSDLVEKFENIVHHEIDGILLFYHDLATDDSLRINKIVIKNSR